MKICLILYLSTLSCNSTYGNSGFVSPDDTTWVEYCNKDITKKTLYINKNKVEELYYSNDKIDSFLIFDAECGEARLIKNKNVSGDILDSMFYIGCSYTEDISHLQTIDSVYSIYLPEQKMLDSFNFTLWSPIEKDKQYYFTISVGNNVIINGTQNSPIIKFTLAYSHTKTDVTYFIRRTINHKGKSIQTQPLPLFKENTSRIKLLSE